MGAVQRGRRDDADREEPYEDWSVSSVPGPPSQLRCRAFFPDGSRCTHPPDAIIAVNFGRERYHAAWASCAAHVPTLAPQTGFHRVRTLWVDDHWAIEPDSFQNAFDCSCKRLEDYELTLLEMMVVELEVRHEAQVRAGWLLGPTPADAAPPQRSSLQPVVVARPWRVEGWPEDWWRTTSLAVLHPVVSFEPAEPHDIYTVKWRTAQRISAEQRRAELAQRRRRWRWRQRG